MRDTKCCLWKYLEKKTLKQVCKVSSAAKSGRVSCSTEKTLTPYLDPMNCQPSPLFEDVVTFKTKMHYLCFNDIVHHVCGCSLAVIRFMSKL